MIDTDRKEGTDMGLLELDKTYNEVWKEYCDSPSGSLKERKASEKLNELDKEIAKKAMDIEYDWGNEPDGFE